MQANGEPTPDFNRRQSAAATGNLTEVHQRSVLSRGNLVETTSNKSLVKETLSTQSKDVLVGWAKGAKEAVATEHAVSEAPRGRSWTALGYCVSPLGIASLGPLHGHTAQS